MQAPTLPSPGRPFGRSPRRYRRRTGHLAAVAAVALVALTGCLQADVGVVLNDDESGEFRVRTVINREQFAQMEDMFGGLAGDDEGPESMDPCTELLEDDMSTDDLPEGAVVEPIDDGKWCGAMAVIPFDNLAEFDRLAAEFADESEEDETGLGTPSITKTDSGYRFSVTGLSMSDDSMGMGEEGMEGMDAFTEMIEQLVGDMRITYDVRLPGKPVDHNADAVDGNRFQWTLEWGDTRTELFAETGAGEPDGSADTGDIDETPVGGDADGGSAGAPGGAASGGATDDGDDGSSLTWLWILIAVVVVAGAVVAIVLINKNKKGNGTPPATPGGPAITPPPPPPPATGQQPTGWQPPTNEG